MEAEINFYLHKDIEISYRVDYDTSEFLFNFDPFKRGDKVCFIELIQNASNEYGSGQAREALTFFLKDMKSQGFTNFYLFAAYDSSYYEKDLGLVGLQRLVKFYSTFGFKELTPVLSVEDQIDMYLDTRAN